MRIVYDDAKANKVVVALHNFMTWKLDIKSVFREENYMERVQLAELKNQLTHFFARDNFQIGNTVTHAYGIGNNCQYPVYYKAKDELQQCCAININIDPFGIGYVSLTDYNGKRISNSYKLTFYGVKINY